MGRAANGVGSIRRKIIRKNGKEYNYWEARYTEGYDPVTGKQKQRSILIRPVPGSLRLEALNPHIIQRFYNSLTEEKDGKPGLAPKSVKNIHGILHKALEQAVALKYLGFNPADK